jgi:hypothetical protein
VSAGPALGGSGEGETTGETHGLDSADKCIGAVPPGPNAHVEAGGHEGATPTLRNQYRSAAWRVEAYLPGPGANQGPRRPVGPVVGPIAPRRSRGTSSNPHVPKRVRRSMKNMKTPMQLTTSRKATTCTARSRTVSTGINHAGGGAPTPPAARLGLRAPRATATGRLGRRGAAPIQPTHPERQQAPLVLQPTEPALHGTTVPVQLLPPGRLAGDQDVQPVGLDPFAGRGAFSGGAAVLGSAALSSEPAKVQARARTTAGRPCQPSRPASPGAG